MKLTFEIAGEKLVERELLRAGQAAVDVRPALAAIADFMIAETREQFDTQGGHASGGWKPVKPATLAAKQRRGQDTRTLHATLALRRSLTLGRGLFHDPNMLLEINETELAYGSKLPYAAAHQNPRPGSRLPRRRPVEFTEHAKRRMVKTLQRWIVTGEVAAP